MYCTLYNEPSFRGNQQPSHLAKPRRKSSEEDDEPNFVANKIGGGFDSRHSRAVALLAGQQLVQRLLNIVVAPFESSNYLVRIKVHRH